MHYSHWQITECCQLPLCSLTRHYGCYHTPLTKPLESYSTFHLRSKAEQQGSSNRVQTRGVHCCFVFTRILLHCVLFLFASAAAANKAQTQLSREADGKRVLYMFSFASGSRCKDSIRWEAPNRLLTPSALARCVTLVTGNKMKLNEETQ